MLLWIHTRQYQIILQQSFVFFLILKLCNPTNGALPFFCGNFSSLFYNRNFKRALEKNPNRNFSSYLNLASLRILT